MATLGFVEYCNIFYRNGYDGMKVKDLKEWLGKISKKYPDIDDYHIEICTDVDDPRMQVAHKVSDFAVADRFVVMIGIEIK